MPSSSRRHGLVLGVAAALVVAGCGGEEFVAEFGCESPEQQVVEGNLLIASPEDVASCSSLVEVEGRLRVAGFDPIADGAEYHSGNDRLTDLRGLERLVRVEELVVENNSALESLAGLEGLREVTKSAIRIYWNDSLVDISAIASVRPVGLSLRGNENLASVSGIEQIMTMQGRLLISGQPVQRIPDLALRSASVVTLDDLPDLVSVPAFGTAASVGSLNLQELPKVDSLSPLRSIAFVERLSVSGLDVNNLGELDAWSTSLREVHVGNLRVSFLSGLEHISELDELSLYMLTDLQSLSALENLREIRGDLMINRLDALEALDFPALERVDGNVEITENPRLSKAAIDDFLERVEITGEVRDCLNATQKPCF